MRNVTDSIPCEPLGSRLVIRLLGDPEVSIGDQPFKGKFHRKVQALLAYLVVEAERRHARELLAAMFWPALPAHEARINLRQTLYYLRGGLDESTQNVLHTTRDAVQFVPGPSCWADVWALNSRPAACETCSPAAAATLCSACFTDLTQRFALYRGDFLTGMELSDAPEFERWHDTQCEKLRHNALSLAERLCNAHETQGELHAAARYALRCVELEPWNEANHRRHMRLLAESGQQAAAESHYERYRDALAAELDVEPEASTRALFEEIRSRSPIEGKSSGDHPGGSPMPRVRRRQSTVVCCHIDLPAGDEADHHAEAVAEAKIDCADMLRTHGGHVTMGHGGFIFAYVGYPFASEKTGEQALQAALELQAHFRAPHVFRAGVYTGTIIASPDRAMPDLVGDVSAAALDLCRQASPGAILVNATTQRIVGSRFGFKPMANQRKRTRSDGDTIYKLLGQTTTDATARDGQDAGSLLLGRRREMARLRAAWESALQGNKQIILIRGAAGLGKSRLARALIEDARAAGANIRELTCVPEHQHTPLYPLMALFTSLCGLHENDTAAERQEKLTGYLKRYHPALVRPAGALLATLFASALSDQPPPTPLRKRETLRIVSALVSSLASRQPLILAIQDIQWLDLSSMDLLEYLAKDTSAAPVLLLLTAREKTAVRWLDAAATIDLQPLGNRDISRMVKASNPGLDTKTIQSIVARADGVPLFAQELARMASDPHTKADSIPPTLHYLLLARMDAVPHALGLMQRAATVGRHVDRALLRQICDLTPVALDAALHHLVSAGLLRMRPAPHHDYQFHHGLIQEAAYTSQIASDRQEAHQRVAEALHRHFPLRAEQQPGQVARHYTAAGNVAAAIPWWTKASSRALRMSAHLEAHEHSRKALELIADLQPNKARNALELSALLRAGHALLALHGYGSAAAIEVYDRAAALRCPETTPEQRFEVAWGLWMVSSSRPGSTFLESGKAADTLLAIARESGQSVMMAEAYSAKANIALWRNQSEDAIVYARASLSYSLDGADSYPWLELMNPHIASLGHLSWALLRQGQTEAAHEVSRRALALADTLGSPSSSCFALFYAAVLNAFALRVPEVESHLRPLSELATTHSIALWQGAAQVLYGWVDACHGRSQGPARILTAIELLQSAMPGTLPCALYLLAHAYGQLQHDDAQRQAIERGVQAAGAVHEEYFKYALEQLRAALPSPDASDCPPASQH